MASIRSERRRLFLDFRWKGVRCRESTGRPDTLADRTELKKFLRQIDGEIAAGTFDYEKYFPHGPKRHVFAPPPRLPANTIPTFADHVRRWMETRRPWLAAGTHYDYRCIIEGHLISHFGDQAVSEIEVEDVEAFVGAVKRKSGTKDPGLSNRRVNMILQVLRLCLDPAVRRGWLEENPARAVAKLKEDRADIDPFSLEEVKLFLAHLPSTRWKRYFTVSFFSGLRPSEQIGLRWDSIDWVSSPPQIVVRRGVTRRGGTGRPKTDSSYRDIPMLPIVERALREQRRQPAPERMGFPK